MATQEIRKQAEALLFSSGRKMEAEEISALIGVDSPKFITEALKQLKIDYETRGSPMMVVEEGTAWKLAVREPYLPLVRKINPYTEFPKSVMETLAVIAWKQPILQSTVIKIRTNKAYDHITELIGMGFVVKEKYGRTSMLKLTQKFYDYFDLQDRERVKDLFKRFKDEEKLENMGQKGSERSGPSEGAGSVGQVSGANPQPAFGRVPGSADSSEAAKIAREKGESVEQEVMDEIADAEDKGDQAKEEEVLSPLGKIEPTEESVRTVAEEPRPAIIKKSATIKPKRQAKLKKDTHDTH